MNPQINILNNKKTDFGLWPLKKGNTKTKKPTNEKNQASSKRSKSKKIEITVLKIYPITGVSNRS